MHKIPGRVTEVVSDITGVTGMAIIQTILRGKRKPLQLAKQHDEKCKRTEAEIAQALYGNLCAEHLFALRQAVGSGERRRAKPPVRLSTGKTPIERATFKKAASTRCLCCLKFA